MSIKTLSKETQNAIALITDPYHDTEIVSVGFPDDKAAYSAVSRFASRHVISCPFVLTTGDTWSFHVYTTPLINRSTMRIRLHNVSSLDLMDVTREIGPVNILYYHYRAGAYFAHTHQALGKYASPPAQTPDFSDKTRTVSLGYEIHNTSAAIDKSGSLTVYRTSPQDSQISLIDAGGSTATDYGALNQTIMFNHILTIPSNIDTAEMLPGTVTWDAAQGVYSVALPEANNPFSSQYHRNAMISFDWNPQFSRQCYVSPGVPAGGTGNIAFSPLRCTGTISSQYANANQTFNLDMRQVTEVVPSARDPNLLAYARRTPDHNPQFLKVYKAMLNKIPAGVPVNQNSAGDWFRKIAEVVREVLPLVPSVLPPQVRPFAMAALPLADALLKKASPQTHNDDTQRFMTNNQIKKTKPPKAKTSPNSPRLTKRRRKALLNMLTTAQQKRPLRKLK